MAAVTYTVLNSRNDETHAVKNKKTAIKRAEEMAEEYNAKVEVITGAGTVVHTVDQPTPDPREKTDGIKNNPGRAGYLPFSQWAGYVLVARYVARQVIAKHDKDTLPSRLALEGSGKAIRQWVDQVFNAEIAELSDQPATGSDEALFVDHIWSFVPHREDRAHYMLGMTKRVFKKIIADAVAHRTLMVCEGAYSREGCGSCENGERCSSQGTWIAETDVAYAEEVIKTKNS